VTAARVGIPVPVVYGGIAAIIALLLAVGFLAGRGSTGGRSTTAPAPMAVPSAAVRIEDPPPAPPAEAAAPITLAPHPATFGAAPVAPRPAAGIPAAPLPASAVPAGAAASPALRREVAEYFRRMDATQSAAKTWSDPSQLAQEVLAQAMQGDSSGFDKLVAATAAARDGVRTMAVPVPCVEHHRLTLALLNEAVGILTKLREGIASGDPSGVAAIAVSSSAIEARARAVDLLAASLRSQYGVEAAP
jgi:hypothetical protein